jgi:hypothetical protein
MYDQTPRCLLDPPQIRSWAVHRTRKIPKINACDRRWVRVDTAHPHIDAAPARTGADVTRRLSSLKPRWTGFKKVRNRYFFTPKVVKHAAAMEDYDPEPTKSDYVPEFHFQALKPSQCTSEWTWYTVNIELLRFGTFRSIPGIAGSRRVSAASVRAAASFSPDPMELITGITVLARPYGGTLV